MGRPRIEKVANHAPCEYCGAPMGRRTINGRLEDNGVFRRRRYCDRRCMALDMVREVVGVTCSRERASAMRGPQCESCGTDRNLHAHHKDRNPLNNHPSNIATLCFVCHMAEHKAHWATALSGPSPQKSSAP